MGSTSRRAADIPIRKYGFWAGVFLGLFLSERANLLTVGGTALMGLGIASFLAPPLASVTAKMHTRLRDARDTAALLTAAVAAELVNVLLLTFMCVIDKDTRTLILRDEVEYSLLMVHVPVALLLFTMWDRQQKSPWSSGG